MVVIVIAIVTRELTIVKTIRVRRMKIVAVIVIIRTISIKEVVIIMLS